MQNEILETYQKLTQATLDNFKKLGETNLQLGEKLLQQQAALTTALIETASKASSADAKDLKAVAALQAELAQEATQKVVEASRNCADIVAEAGKVYTNLFEQGLKATGCTASACSTEGKASKKAA